MSERFKFPVLQVSSPKHLVPVPLLLQSYKATRWQEKPSGHFSAWLWKSDGFDQSRLEDFWWLKSENLGRKVALFVSVTGRSFASLRFSQLIPLHLLTQFMKIRGNLSKGLKNYPGKRKKSDQLRDRRANITRKQNKTKTCGILELYLLMVIVFSVSEKCF